MTEQLPNEIPPPPHVPGLVDASGDALSDWDLILPLTPPAVRPREAVQARESVQPRDPLQEGIEEILERLRASDARRAGAMARLEVMMEQWPEQQSDAPAANVEPLGSRLARIPPAHIADPIRTAVALLHPESTERSSKTEWLQARERMPPPTVSVEPWPNEARPHLHVVPGSDDDTQKSDSEDLVQILASRVDALELAAKVSKEELTRAKGRVLALERWSSFTLAALFLSIVFIGLLVFVLFRQLDTAHSISRTTVLTPQIEPLSKSGPGSPSN